MAKHLKPCPFCGAPAVIGYRTSKPTETDEFSAFCVGCGAQTEWYNTNKAARKAWNHRKEKK